MQVIITKFISPTNTRGARIKVTSWQGSKFYSYDYAATCAHEAAFNEWLNEKNAQMLKDYGTECSTEGWFKMVAKGNLPDDSGYGFVIQ